MTDFCRDCRHYEPPTAEFAARCHRAEQVTTCINERFDDALQAYQHGTCGMNGRFWEPKKAAA